MLKTKLSEKEKKAYKKAWYKKHGKEYFQRPEVKARAKRYVKERARLPEVRISQKYRHIKHRAKVKGLPCLTKEQFFSWWESRIRTRTGLLVCEICEEPVTENTHSSSPSHLNIDRKDNNQSIGYTLSNIAITCRRCNSDIKGSELSFEAAYFVTKLDKIKNQKKRGATVKRFLKELSF